MPCAPPSPEPAALSSPLMSVDGVILVHGGYHGAWCWDAVRPLLERPSVAVDLPGRGTRPAGGMHVTLADCVHAVLADADAAGFERFLLVGHSLGGLTITETASRAPERVAHLVYLAALAPAPGTTVFDIYFPDGGAPDVVDPTGVQPLLDADTAHRMFAGDLDDGAFAAAHAQCVPEPIGLFLEGVSGYDSGVAATYVRCTRDGAVPPALAAAMIANLRPAAVIDLDSDHDVMLSHPADVAHVLDEVAAGL